MLTKVFNFVRGVLFTPPVATSVAQEPHKMPYTAKLGDVMIFPHTYPSSWISEADSSRFIELCRGGDLLNIQRMVRSNERIINATEYMPARQVKGSMTVHWGDGIDCMTAVQASVVAKQNHVLQYLVEGGARVPHASLIRAGADGNLDALKIMYGSNGMQFDRDHPEAMTIALVAACRGGHRACANFLLDQGALIDGAKGGRPTGNPLAEAMMSTSTGLVEDLLRRGADVNRHGIQLCERYREVNEAAVQLVRAARSSLADQTPPVEAEQKHFIRRDWMQPTDTPPSAPPQQKPQAGRMDWSA